MGNKIVMCGCLESGWEAIKFLLQQGVSISYFVTITAEKAVKANVSGFKDFKPLADQYNIPIYYVNKYSLNSKEDTDFFYNNKFDLMIQGGWQRLFPDDVLRTLSIGAIGIHGSADFLPQGRGRSPINWSLIDGRRRFIFHFFLIKPGIDDGDIFYYEMVDINEWDTCKTLYYKNAIITARVYSEWIPKLLNNSYKLHEQVGTPTYYPKRTAEDGIINWKKSVFDIYNFIRALTHPYPGAFSYIKEFKVTIWNAQPFDTRISFFGRFQGEIVKTFANGDLVVNCNGGVLLITQYSSEINLQEGMVFNDNYL